MHSHECLLVYLLYSFHYLTVRLCWVYNCCCNKSWKFIIGSELSAFFLCWVAAVLSAWFCVCVALKQSCFLSYDIVQVGQQSAVIILIITAFYCNFSCLSVILSGQSSLFSFCLCIVYGYCQCYLVDMYSCDCPPPSKSCHEVGLWISVKFMLFCFLSTATVSMIDQLYMCLCVTVPKMVKDALTLNGMSGEWTTFHLDTCYKLFFLWLALSLTSCFIVSS